MPEQQQGSPEAMMVRIEVGKERPVSASDSQEDEPIPPPASDIQAPPTIETTPTDETTPITTTEELGTPADQAVAAPPIEEETTPSVQAVTTPPTEAVTMPPEPEATPPIVTAHETTPPTEIPEVSTEEAETTHPSTDEVDSGKTEAFGQPEATPTDENSAKSQEEQEEVMDYQSDTAGDLSADQPAHTVAAMETESDPSPPKTAESAVPSAAAEEYVNQPPQAAMDASDRETAAQLHPVVESQQSTDTPPTFIGHTPSPQVTTPLPESHTPSQVTKPPRVGHAPIAAATSLRTAADARPAISSDYFSASEREGEDSGDHTSPPRPPTAPKQGKDKKAEPVEVRTPSFQFSNLVTVF